MLMTSHTDKNVRPAPMNKLCCFRSWFWRVGMMILGERIVVAAVAFVVGGRRISITQ
jgi:hypothetical protein